MICVFQKLPFFYMVSFIRKESFLNYYSYHKIRMIVVWKISSLIKMKPLQVPVILVVTRQSHDITQKSIWKKLVNRGFILTWLEDFLCRPVYVLMLNLLIRSSLMMIGCKKLNIILWRLFFKLFFPFLSELNALDMDAMIADVQTWKDAQTSDLSGPTPSDLYNNVLILDGFRMYALR